MDFDDTHILFGLCLLVINHRNVKNNPSFLKKMKRGTKLWTNRGIVSAYPQLSVSTAVLTRSQTLQAEEGKWFRSHIDHMRFGNPNYFRLLKLCQITHPESSQVWSVVLDLEAQSYPVNGCSRSK